MSLPSCFVKYEGALRFCRKAQVMQSQLYSIGIGAIAIVALQRAAIVHYSFFARFLAYRKRAVATPSSWTDYITYAEPTLLLALTLFLWKTHEVPADPTAFQLASVCLGATVAFAALALQVWCLRAFPTLSVGHYVLPDQRVVTDGPYAYVRHPIYTAALMIWVSVAIGFGSTIAGLITIAYVVPSYYIYSRSEEEMMLQHFGDAYRVYRDGTGGFLPRLTQFHENVTQESSSETNR